MCNRIINVFIKCELKKKMFAQQPVELKLNFEKMTSDYVTLINTKCLLTSTTDENLIKSCYYVRKNDLICLCLK